MKIYWLTVVLCILVLSSSVAAEGTKEFVIYSPDRELSACGCQTITDTVVLYNLAGKDSWYKLESSNPWVSIPDNVLFIEKGSSKEAELVISVPCDGEDSSYTLSITSLTGYRRTITKPINIEPCQNLKTALVVSDDLLESNSTINPCETVKFDLYIQNSGPYKEEYSYSVRNYPELNDTFLLEPLNTQKIPLEFTPKCEVYGEIGFIVDVKTTGSNLKATLSHNIFINQNYDFSLVFPAYDENTMYVCKEDTTTLPLKLINLVDVPNNYSLNMDAPGYVTLSENFVELAGDGEKELEVYISPQGSKSAFTVSVKVDSEIGDASTETEIDVIPYTCYDIELKIDADEAYSCTDNEFLVNIMNKADIDRSIDLHTEGIASLDEDEAVLGSFETTKYILEIDNPKDNNDYEIFVKAYVGEREVAGSSFVYHSLSDFYCTRIVIDNDFVKVNYQTPEKWIRIANTGLQYETYDVILVEGPEWVRISEEPVELFDGEVKDFMIYFDDRTDVPEGDYPVTITFYSDGTEQTYDHTITIQLKDKSAVEKGYDKVYLFFISGIAQSILFYLIIALLIMIIILILIKATAPKYPYKVKNKVKQKSGLLWFLILVFAISVVVVYALGGTPYFPQAEHYLTESEETDALQWAEDTSYTFNISQYVVDPDMDMLEFGISELDNIDAVIADGVVTFTPEKDWFGEEQVFFIATDIFGHSSTSEIITLRVVDVPEFTFWDYFKPWIWTLNLLVWLCILTVFFFMFIVHNRRKKNGPKGKKNSKNL